jgi:hypothetical protein
MPDLKSELNNNYSSMPMAGQSLPLTVVKFTYYPHQANKPKNISETVYRIFHPKIIPIMVNAKNR